MGSPEDGSTRVPARWLAGAAAGAAGAIGCLGLIGWRTEANWVHFLRDQPQMMPSAAVTLVVAAVSLTLRQASTPQRRAWRYASGALSGALVAAVGALTLAEYLWRVNFRINLWLYVKRLGILMDSPPGRPSYYTAVAFLLLGGALLCAYLESRYDRLISQALALAAGLVGALAIEGYVIAYPPFYKSVGGAGMSLHTAVAVILLAAGVLLMFPREGIMALLASDGPGGETARLLLPLPLFVSFILSWLGLAGSRAGFYDHNVGVWLLQLSNVVVFTFLILIVVRRIERADRQRRQAEQGLRESQERYQKLFDFNPCPSWVYDVERSRFWAVNRAAVCAYGYTVSEFLSLRVAEIVPAEDIGVLPADLAQVQAREPNSGVRQHRKKDGTLIDVEVSSCEVALSGRPARIVLAVDVTERKRMEEERRRYLAEIESRNSELEIRRQEAVRATRMKSDFLAAISHELRTPLNAIIGFSELLAGSQKETLTERQQRHIGHVHTASIHLLALVNDILDLSKIEAGQLEFRPERVVVAESLAEVLCSMMPLAAQKSIRIESDIASCWTVRGDRKRLKQILYNLIGNALKFTPAHGTVLVKAEREEAFIRISVSDTGIGIRPEEHVVIFDPYRQVKGTTDKYEGTGLGLALTKQLVERQGGTIWVESELQRGSRFSFTLRAD